MVRLLRRNIQNIEEKKEKRNIQTFATNYRLCPIEKKLKLKILEKIAY